ncbi:MAG TPA: hypothetical protein VHG51_21100 [Longimicrobiaceae bacterium]|nr:hypothetical protein [Longimicrobiaceae bacterium]
MEQTDPARGSPAEREETARRALDAYRERRRRRRAEDTYFGSSDCHLAKAEAGVDEGELSSRRIEVLQAAEAAGMPPGLAGMLYDVAREEGLDPVLGFELVRCGLGVCPPDGGVSNAPEQPTRDKYLPEWLSDAVPPDELLRERMLRLSFRRLLSLLERYEEVDDAFRAFALEPDVGYLGY